MNGTMKQAFCDGHRAGFFEEDKQFIFKDILTLIFDLEKYKESYEKGYEEGVSDRETYFNEK